MEMLFTYLRIWTLKMEMAVLPCLFYPDPVFLHIDLPQDVLPDFFAY